jgi:ornithine cyclodeaminase/alanine dehydrogenase-like protein (mu-crystallin family)
MGPTTPIRFITTGEIRSVLTRPAAIRAVGDALIGLSTGRALMPARPSLEIPGTRTTALVMPACLPGPNRIGLKLISLCEDTPAKGLPFAQPITIGMDAEIGTPRAVLEAGHLTAVGTGAASRVAVAGLVLS